jgi:hypothetical protein
MECSQCGALVQDNQGICPACGGQVRKRSFWQRLWQFLGLPEIARIKVIRKVKIENLTLLDPKTDKKKVFYSLDQMPPELRAKCEEALASGLGQMVNLEELSPELRAKVEQAKATGQWQLMTMKEMPPELQAKFDQAVASGHAITEEFFSFQSPDGKRQVFHSLDEVPAELRAKIEEARKLGQSSARRFFSFSFQGPDGQTHTYHSLEEMPPDIRALFQQNLPSQTQAEQ